MECGYPAEERCVGGRFSACGKEYMGIGCSNCKPNHYYDFGGHRLVLMCLDVCTHMCKEA